MKKMATNAEAFTLVTNVLREMLNTMQRMVSILIEMRNELIDIRIAVVRLERGAKSSITGRIPEQDNKITTQEE